MTEWITEFINSIGSWGPMLACLLIMAESMLPILPLCVFIVIIFLAYGNIVGLLISWLFTVLGCIIAFVIVRNGFKNWFTRKVLKNKKINSIMKTVDKWKFQQIVVILSIPFTPAFAVNIAAGLSNINLKKYIGALVIGKLFMVYFWGYVGISFIDCLSNPIAIVRIVVMVFAAYLLSKFVNKKFDLDERV